MRSRLALGALCIAVLTADGTAVPAGLADATPRPHLLVPHHPCGRMAHKRPAIRHVIVMVLENKPITKIIGHAGFITALAHRCGLAGNYHHNARVSLPNYLAMTSGSTHGLHKNCPPK